MTDKIFLLDTETVGLPPRNFIYDIGWLVTDRYGNISKRRNFLIKDVITDGKKMMGAFFARKIFSFYIPALDSGTIKLFDLSDVQAIMYDDLRHCKTIAAYNLGFDLSALKNTVDICNNQEDLYLDDYKNLCLWSFACRALLPFRTYRKLADAKGWKSKAGNYKTTAEHTYRYITGQTDFIESHTAMDDCIIENEIMKRCFARKKTIPYNMVNCAPWRWVQTPEQLATMRNYPKQLEIF